MRFFFFSDFVYENWDYRNPDTIGIGGSETAQIEMAWRLAARRHEVVSFAPLPDETDDKIHFKKHHKNVCWQFPDAAEEYYGEKGIWVLSRWPQQIDDIPKDNGQKIWLVAQDVDYPGMLTPERIEKLDLLLALNPTHAEYLKQAYPEVTKKIIISSNGLKVKVIEEIEKTTPVERNPYRIIFTPSPDRGLLRLLTIFERAREFEPRLELFACYGMDNIGKYEGQKWRDLEKNILEGCDSPGVTWLGRLPQTELYKQILSSGMFVYPTTFTETSCVNIMEAQAMGAVPIFSPIWALDHNGGHGIAIDGNPDEPLTRCRFVNAIIRLTRFPELQEQIRSEMVLWARYKFDWERVVDQYEELSRTRTTVGAEDVPKLSLEDLKDLQDAISQ
jgi:protein O-GlcNAc transferase